MLTHRIAAQPIPKTPKPSPMNARRRIEVEATRHRDIVPPDLAEPLEKLNEARRVSAHFKPPLHDGSLMSRAQAMDEPDILESAEELAEADAFAAYETCRSLLHRARWT